MTSYTLVIVDSEGNRINQSSLVTTGRSLSLEVNRLMENSLYSYYIMATTIGLEIVNLLQLISVSII